MRSRVLRRRAFLRIAAASALAFPARLRARSPRPNILFIQTDSWDGRVLGCMGHPAMRRATPHIDALARRGVVFRNAYTNNPICCPSRASMWSGTYTHTCEGWNNHKGLEKGAPTFRTRLEAAGYRARTYGKLDYLSGAHTIRARVTAWTRSASILRPQYRMEGPRIIPGAGARIHGNDWRDVDRTVRWLGEAAASRRPFLLYLGIRAPHPAFAISERYLARIDDASVTLPPRDRRDHPVMRYQRVAKNWMHGFADGMVREVRRIYYAMCAEVDAMVGEVLAALERSGLADATAVIFTSDHGENAMEHRQFYKMNHYESSARVPLIIAGPGVRKGAQVERPVSLIDLFPTLTDLSGIARPAGLEGHSLVPDLAGRSGDRPDWVLAEFHDSTCNTGAFMLRRGPWKYIAYAGHPPQLFHLEDDPDEVRDLAADRPEVVRAMDARLRRIVDYEAVDAKAKAYDRASFRAWRRAMKAEGRYEETMARVFSGWDHLSPADIRPWTAEEEARLEAWLEA